LQSGVIHVVFGNCCLIGETMPAKFGVWWCGPGVAAVFVVGLLWASPSAQEAQFFRIGAAATSGTFFEVGGMIASAISKPAGSPPCERGGNCGVPGLVAVTQATQGSVENLRMVAAGQIESGIAQSDIVSWAYAGTGIFAAEGPMKRLRAIANLFPEYVQVVVHGDSAIRTLADLRGKRVSLGQMGSGTLADARVVLAAAGLTEKDMTAEYLRPGVAAANVSDGTLDGFFLIGGVPVPAIRELAATTPIRLVPIDDQLPAARSDAPVRALERADLRARLLAALARLAPIQREIVVLADVEHWPHDRIAAATGISVVMSRRHLSDARRRLRDLLSSSND